MANQNDKIAEAVGLPDEQDKLRIRQWLIEYDKKNPGVIKSHRDYARDRLKDPTYGVVETAGSNLSGAGHGANRRYLFELPEEFGHWMSQAYPLMFKSKSHLRWFIKNFPELLIPERY